MADDVVLAEELAVVGGDHDERVLVAARAFRVGDQLTERRVHRQDLPVVVGGDELALLLAEIRRDRVREETFAREARRVREIACPEIVGRGRDPVMRLEIVHEDERRATCGHVVEPRERRCVDLTGAPEGLLHERRMRTVA